jgi:hypothetical protein
MWWWWWWWGWGWRWGWGWGWKGKWKWRRRRSWWYHKGFWCYRSENPWLSGTILFGSGYSNVTSILGCSNASCGKCLYSCRQGTHNDISAVILTRAFLRLVFCIVYKKYHTERPSKIDACVTTSYQEMRKFRLNRRPWLTCIAFYIYFYILK